MTRLHRLKRRLQQYMTTPVRMVFVMFVAGFCLLNVQSVKAHVQVENNAFLDAIAHFQGQLGDGQTFRDWSGWGLNGDANPANAYCRVVVEKVNLPNAASGNPRAAYRFKIVGNSDARAHAFEAGAYVDSTTDNCQNEFNDAWDGTTVNTDSSLFNNPLANATKVRPTRVALGVNGTDVSNSTPLKPNGEPALLETVDDWSDFDASEKAAAGIKARTDGGVYGILSDGGGFKVGPDLSDMQTIWCAGIDFGSVQPLANSLGRPTNIRWPGTFQGDCRYDYRFKSGTNTSPGGGNFDTNWGAYVKGGMGSTNATGSYQSAGALRCISISCPIGSEIPGISRDSNGMVNDFSLVIAGIKNQDGSGTYNGNPELAKSPDFATYGLSADARALFGPNGNPRKVAFAEAWMTVEWDRTVVPPPTPTLTCSLRLSVGSPEAGQPFNVFLDYNYQASGGDIQVQGNVSLNGTTPAVNSNFGPTTISPNSSGTIHTVNNIRGDANNYTVTASIVRGGSGLRDDCTKTFTIASKPYFKVWANDVQVGGGFKNALGTCSVDSDATVIGYGGDGSSDIFKGASAQYAVFAMGELRNYFSAGQRSPRQSADKTKWPTPPHGLTFANAQVPLLSGPGKDPADGNKVANYGGMSGLSHCTQDWLATVPTTASVLDPSFFYIDFNLNNFNNSVHFTKDSGVVEVRGGDTSRSRSVFVTDPDVDVVIKNDINVANGESVYIVAAGNIKIAANVRNIDAVLITKKTLFTCTKSGGSAWRTDELFEACGADTDSGKLTITGAVIANQVKFQRTFGTRNNSIQNEGRGSNEAAEEIIFDPTLYIKEPAIAAPDKSNANIDFITSLPPLL